MAAIQYYDVILKPVITEKSMAGMSEKIHLPEIDKALKYLLPHREQM